jgi:hypothetical protein
MKVTGKVIDFSGQPIAGATIIVKDSFPLQGFITDFDGNFIINVPANSILEFSHVGSPSKLRKNIGTETYIEVALANETQLNELDVYGAKKSRCNWLCWLAILGGGFAVYKLATKKAAKKVKI